ncbi:MAG: adenylate/guanylate cyclase domain-containing protein, partial [Nannocystaceae bacterium]
LVEMFCQNATVALDNQRLHEEQMRLLAAVSRFVPTTLLKLVGQRDVTEVDTGDHIERPMTVMFADLRGFTALAEKMSSREMFRMINDLFGELVPWIYEHQGVVDKYLGDGLMALFPRECSDAVKAAAAMLDAVKTFNLKFGASLPGAIRLSMGIHSGEVILGMVGSATRLDTTVMSDGVNLAARIERLTRKIMADLLITEAVYRQLDPALQAECRFLGKLSVRGKTTRVAVYEVVAADLPSLRAAKLAVSEQLLEIGAMMVDERWWSARDQLYNLCPKGLAR